MRDEFAYESPLGILGRIADILFLERYLRSFLIERNRVIKAAAESDGWRQYVRDVPERFGTADDADSTDIGKS